MEAVGPPDRGNLYIDFVTEFITPDQWCRMLLAKQAETLHKNRSQANSATRSTFALPWAG